MIKLDKIVTIDVECTCWQGNPPAGERQEIIEIGVVLLDVKTKTISNKRSILIKPDFSMISEFCTNLTTLKQIDVDKGISLTEAYEILRKEYLSLQRVFASYGNFDRLAFQRDCAAKGVPFPFGPTHLNVKNLFAIKHSLSKEVGTARALQMLKIPFEGTPHRGADDSFHVAKILSSLL